MPTYDGLSKRVMHLEAEYRQLFQSPKDEMFSGIDVSMLTSDEQRRWCCFLAQLRDRLTTRNGGVDLRDLTGVEVYELSYWLGLMKSLTQEDRDAAAKYRRYLNENVDLLIETFLALDESMIPEFDQAPTVEGHTLYRTNFRSDRAMVQRGIATNGPGIGIEKMWLWCDTFATLVSSQMKMLLNDDGSVK